MTTLIDELRQRLASLQPLQLEIADDSELHKGHAAAGQGGHFRLQIVASVFAGLPTMRRHRLVYDAVADLMPARIHALAIQARTPDEVHTKLPSLENS